LAELHAEGLVDDVEFRERRSQLLDEVVAAKAVPPRNSRRVPQANAVIAVLAAVMVLAAGSAFAWGAAHKGCLDRSVDALNAATYEEITSGDDKRISAELSDCTSWKPTEDEAAEMRSRIKPEIASALQAKAKRKLESVGRAIS
jgi:hypothetical protein